MRATDWLLKCALSLNLASSERSCLYLGKNQTTTWQVEVLSVLIPQFSLLVTLSAVWIGFCRLRDYPTPGCPCKGGGDLRTSSFRMFVPLLKMFPGPRLGLWSQNLGEGTFFKLVGLWVFKFFFSFWFLSKYSLCARDRYTHRWSHQHHNRG